MFHFFAGLLTVDPKRRLTMHELQTNEWVQGSNANVFSVTPLVTPDVLSFNNRALSKTHNQLCATISAFHKATREGFRLQDVGNARLAQRRKNKKSSGSSRSSSNSSLSSCTSHGSLTPTKSLTSSPARNYSNTSNNSQGSTASMGFVPGKAQPPLETSGYFSFRESRIAALTPTMSTVQEGDSSTEARGVKRKLDIADDDDDDCVIIGEESGPSAFKPIKRDSDAMNNNAKRPRSDTIIIE